MTAVSLPPLPLKRLLLLDHDGRRYAFSGDSLLLAEVSDDLHGALCLGLQVSESRFAPALRERLGVRRAEEARGDMVKLALTGFFEPRAVRQQLLSMNHDQVEANMASPPRPTSVQVAVSGVCNLRCTYCYADYGGFNSSASAQFVSLDVMRGAVRLLMTSQKEGVIVGLLGGEPLLHPALDEMLAAAGAEADRGHKRLTFALDTNGTTLTPGILRTLTKHPVKVAVSLDGPPEVQNRQRPFADGRPSYPVVIENARRLAEALGPERVCVNMTCTPMSVARALAFYEEVRSLVGPVRVRLAPAFVPPAHAAAWTAEAAHLWRTISRRLVELEHRDRKNPQLAPTVLDEHPLTHRTIRSTVCAFATTQLAVSVEGDIYPCIGLVGREEFLMGNVISGEIMHPPAVLDCARRASCREECEDCWAKHLCAGGCPVVHLATSGDYSRATEPTCTVLRAASEAEVVGFLMLRATAVPAIPTRTTMC